MKAYDKGRLHPASTDVVAQNLGYKGASSGSALSAMASLRYYGLLERPGDGLLAVTKDVEAFSFASDARVKRSLLLGFLRRPTLYAELLETWAAGLPSDANLKHDLIQRGFLPGTAGEVVSVFRRSVEFARYFEGERADLVAVQAPAPSSWPVAEPQEAAPLSVAEPRAASSAAARPPTLALPEPAGHDQIPVRLPGGRRAWLVIPTPFYEADKLRLKAQIDLLLTEEDASPKDD